MMHERMPPPPRTSRKAGGWVYVEITPPRSLTGVYSAYRNPNLARKADVWRRRLFRNRNQAVNTGHRKAMKTNPGMPSTQVRMPCFPW